MSVADHFGLDDPESPLMAQARAGWPQWCADDPALAVVEDLRDLRGWTLHAPARDKDVVMVRLVALAKDDQAAAIAVVWLLLPGATLLGDRLRDLDPDIDGMIAGQLWLEVREAHRHQPRWLPRTILNQTSRAVKAELGIGDAARRRDPVWSQAVHLDDCDFRDRPCQPDGREAREALMELLSEAFRDHAIEWIDMWFLYELAVEANRRSAPMHRGRFGLTAPTVVESVARRRPESERTIRRRVGNAIDDLAEYVEARLDEDRFARWKAAHPDRLPTAKELLAEEFADHTEDLTTPMPDPAALASTQAEGLRLVASA